LRVLASLAIAVLFASANTLAQTTTNAPASTPTNTPQAPTEESDDEAWSFSASAYTCSLSWRKLELYSEGELVFDSLHSSDSFFYNWSELTLASVDRFRFGLVTQRTRAYESDRAIQRGLLLGFNYKKVDLSAYLFNPDDDKPTFVIAVKLSF
jgi:hypothetical protein